MPRVAINFILRRYHQSADKEGMELLLIGISALCTLWIFPPMLREARLAHARNALEQFRDFQAYAVLRYHPAFSEDPELSQLSIVELRREYNLSALYDELGRG